MVYSNGNIHHALKLYRNVSIVTYKMPDLTISGFHFDKAANR